jgi:hypothetical protein
MQPEQESRHYTAGADSTDSNSHKSYSSKMDQYDDDVDKKRNASNKNDNSDDKNDDDDGDLDDGDPSSNYSASGKKDKTIGGKTGKKKKKHGGYLSGHHKAFRNSVGYEIFNRASPIPADHEEEDVITHVVGKKPLLGKVWRDKNRGDYTRYRCYNYGVEYKSGDAVYIESQRPELPYYICCIQVIFPPIIFRKLSPILQFIKPSWFNHNVCHKLILVSLFQVFFKSATQFFIGLYYKHILTIVSDDRK